MGSLTAPWLPLSPAPDPDGYAGRPSAMAISSDIDGRGTHALLIATPGGGVWKSTNYMSLVPTWQPLMTSYSFAPVSAQPAIGNIGAIAVDPFRPRVLYAYSGAADGGGDDSYGAGLIKSTNGGASWSYIGHMSGGSGFHPGANRIFVDPTGFQESCAAGPCAGSHLFANGDAGPPHTPPTVTTRGLYKSIDSGAHWTSIQSNLPANVDVTDLDYEVFGGQLILYAGVVDISGSNPGATAIYKSTNQGASWTRMSFTQILDWQGNTRPKSDIASIKLALNRVINSGAIGYALLTGKDSVALNVFSKYRSWIPTSPGLSDGSHGVGTFSGYSIALDPEDGSVYVGGNYTGICQSRDGGNSWFNIAHGANGVVPHVDQHSWAFENGVVFNGNDGGVYRFDPLPNGRSGPGNWTILNTPSLRNLLSHFVGPHPVYPNVLLASSHDNETIIRNSGTWSSVHLDEDFRMRFDPFDGTYAYGTNGQSVCDWFYVSTDGGHSYQDLSPTCTNVPGSAQLAFHMTTAGRLAAGLGSVWESTSHGIFGWRNIGRPSSVPADYTVGALAYGTGDVIYAAWSNRLFRTTNDGADGWPEPNPGFNFGGGITGIAVDRENPNRVYLAIDAGRIWRSADAGSSWTEITGDFPQALLTAGIALRSDSPALEPQVLLATGNAPWVGQLQGASWHWQRLGSGIPDGNVRDIQYNPINKVAYVAVSARGIFGSYLSFNSDAAPGSLAAGNTTFAFGKDLDGRILANQAAYGNSYSGWNQLQGNGRVSDAIGASFLSSANVLFAFGRGLDNHVYLNQAGFGAAWTGWFPVPGMTTDAAPASTSSPVRNQVWVFAKGTDQRIYQNHATYGQAFVGWTEVPGGGLTNSAIAAATVTGPDATFLAVRGLDGAIWTNQGPTGSYGGWSRDGSMTTDVAPALAADSSTIYWFAKSLDGRVMMAKAAYGSGGSGWSEVPGGLITNAPVSAAVLQNGVVFLYAKDLSGRIMVNQGLGGQFGNWFEVGGGLF